MGICSKDDCDKPSRKRGLCQGHYSEWYRQRPGEKCSECGKTAVSHGLCPNHYGQHVQKYGKFPRESIQDRFWRKVDKAGPIPAYNPSLGPCWIWTDEPSSGGYGKFYIGNRQEYSHRIAYEWEVGPIPENLPQLDHLCRVRICCNPTHLEPVTNRENSIRGDGPRLTHERVFERTHCLSGKHLFDEKNTYWYKGRRRCKQCAADRQKRRD